MYFEILVKLFYGIFATNKPITYYNHYNFNQKMLVLHSGECTKIMNNIPCLIENNIS